MALLGWFDTAEVDAFAAALVAELAQRMPPGVVADTGRKAGGRLHRMTEALSQRAREFAQSHRLNVFKRARLGSRVKWALREAGYPEAFTEAFTYELVTLVTVASKNPASSRH